MIHISGGETNALWLIFGVLVAILVLGVVFLVVYTYFKIEEKRNRNSRCNSTKKGRHVTNPQGDTEPLLDVRYQPAGGSMTNRTHSYPGADGVTGGYRSQTKILAKLRHNYVCVDYFTILEKKLQ